MKKLLVFVVVVWIHNEVAVHRHLVVKVVRVHGDVQRIPQTQGSGFMHWLRIDSLDQIERVTAEKSKECDSCGCSNLGSSRLRWERAQSLGLGFEFRRVA